MGVTKKIVVHEKALAHLSRGLYRSPASAVRELISNGWDANARNVHVDTNYPTFFQVSIKDDGDGFSKDEFERLMGGNIGNSDKRPKNEALVNGRPTIGRLGIGMLGIAQICGAFKITSKPKDGKPFAARVRLYDLLKERLDKDDAELIKDKTSPAVGNIDSASYKEIDVGEYEYLPFDSDIVEQGTLIVTDDIHPTFTQTFLESLKLDAFFSPTRDWSSALAKIAKVHSLQQLGDYWRFVWELSASCPIPYVSASCLPDGLAKADYERLKAYDFNVFVDGLQLFKPIKLQNNPSGYTTRKIDDQTERIYGRDLRFHGYLAVQEGLQLRPDEIRGIMIRIKDVGIGYYDPSMLDYRFNEGPRSRWLTGEIFVTEGLEDALNIDRDSFNKFHPQYRAVQRYVHNLLHEELFKEVYKNIDVRSKKRATEKTAQRRKSFKRAVQAAGESAVSVRYAKKSEDTNDPSVSTTSKGTEVVIPDPDGLPTKKAHRELAAAVITIFDIAMKERTVEDRRKIFQSMLFELLSSW
jgi:hypothetical protein